MFFVEEGLRSHVFGRDCADPADCVNARIGHLVASGGKAHVGWVEASVRVQTQMYVVLL